MDNAVIRPLPRAKRMLSEAGSIPHVVQLLLTFDPSLVEKVVTLLNDIMRDNPYLPRVFSSGIFFFIMMYTGFNILPIAHFLKYAHTKQSFRPDEVTTPPCHTPTQTHFLHSIDSCITIIMKTTLTLPQDSHMMWC